MAIAILMRPPTPTSIAMELIQQPRRVVRDDRIGDRRWFNPDGPGWINAIHSVAAGIEKVSRRFIGTADIEDLGNPGNSEESMRLHRSVKPTQNRGSNTMPIPA